MRDRKSVLHTVIIFVFWICTAAVMSAIFWFSCENGEKSAELSSGLLSVFESDITLFIHNLFRKFAHLTEFGALGFFFAGSIYFTFNSRKIFMPLIPCTLYAISDEVHQYFVPERACRILDIFIDSFGSLVGILIFTLIVFIIRKVMQRKKLQSKKYKLRDDV